MRRSLWVLGLALGVPAIGTGEARAASITYQVADLPDSAPGEDLWQYTYGLSGAALAAGQGFDVFFAVADGFEFGDLVGPQTGPDPDWDVLAIQADPGLGADGLFDAVALVDDPPLAGTFTSTFIWRGAGAPGAQHFELFDEQLQVTESGTTRPMPVPEPSACLPAALVWLGLAARARL